MISSSGENWEPISLDTLSDMFCAVQRHDDAVRQGWCDYARQMAPYQNKSVEVMVAAHTLATSAAHGVLLHPSVAEQAKAIINKAGMVWGKE